MKDLFIEVHRFTQISLILEAKYSHNPLIIVVHPAVTATT